MAEATDNVVSSYQRVTWYAGEDRASNTWKFLVYDDKGLLTIDAEKLFFNGANDKITIRWSDVLRIEYRKQRFATKLAAVFVAIISVFGGISGALDDPHPIFYAIAGAAFAPVLYWQYSEFLSEATSNIWTVLYYRTPEGTSQSWFADGQWLGWAAKGGRATNLRDAIAAHCSMPINNIDGSR